MNSQVNCFNENNEMIWKINALAEQSPPAVVPLLSKNPSWHSQLSVVESHTECVGPHWPISQLDPRSSSAKENTPMLSHKYKRGIICVTCNGYNCVQNRNQDNNLQQ